MLCLICGSNLPSPGLAAIQSIQTCPVCTNGVTQPAPDLTALLAEDWQCSYRGQPLNQPSSWKRKAQLQLEWIQLYQPEGPMLAAGCGTGEFLEIAEAQGYEIYGIEPSRSGFRNIQHLDTQVIHEDLYQAIESYRDFRFDSVVLWDSLTYTPNPLQMLIACRKLLSQHGKIFIEVPNRASEDAKRLDLAWPLAQLDQRFCHFTESGLRYTLDAAGLRVDYHLAFSARVYSEHSLWKQWKNQSLLSGHAWPSLDWMRVIASARSSSLPNTGDR